MPIFEQHFTVSHVEHIPQSIEENIITLLDLSKDFSSSHSVFYNGRMRSISSGPYTFSGKPERCHSVEHEAAVLERRRRHKRIGEVDVFSLADFSRATVMLESKKKQDLEFGFLRLTGAMRRVMNTTKSRWWMLSVHIRMRCGGLCFPRTKHRPHVYFWRGKKGCWSVLRLLIWGIDCHTDWEGFQKHQCSACEQI